MTKPLVSDECHTVTFGHSLLLSWIQLMKW